MSLRPYSVERPARPMLLALLMIAFVMAFARFSPACSVPVFRYALEHWAPDAYHVYVLHRGPLAATEQELVDRLDSDWDPMSDEPTINVRVTPVDLDSKDDAENHEIWDVVKEQSPDATLPWMVVCYPQGGSAQGISWSAPFSAAEVDAALDSPVRQQIARHIMDGEAAVWVLLEGAEANMNDAAAELLKNEIERMEGILELPEIAAQDVGYLTGGDEAIEQLKVHFSIIRVSKEDKAERALVKMLMRSEPDLESDYADVPIAFPIFGRGRVLFALVNKGITAANIAESCAFVVGSCSCQVKDMNPGTDLLMTANWRAWIDPSWQAALYTTDPNASTADLSELAPDAPPSRLNQNLLIAVALVLLMSVVPAVALLRRRR